MALWAFVRYIYDAVGGAAIIVLLVKYVGDRLLQRQTEQHSKEQAEMQNAFSMGATSHMATVAFDRYVSFCEEYVEAMSNALYTFIQAEAKGKPLDARGFSRIRQKWALWLTDDVESKLDEFERRITRVHSEAPVYDPDGTQASIESSIKSVIAVLRKVLATEELTALRSELVVGSLKKRPQLP
jgi:uncharacterized protein (DUF2267 family)